jgi:hypothetical protein
MAEPKYRRRIVDAIALSPRFWRLSDAIPDADGSPAPGARPCSVYACEQRRGAEWPEAALLVVAAQDC